MKKMRSKEVKKVFEGTRSRQTNYRTKDANGNDEDKNAKF